MKSETGTVTYKNLVEAVQDKSIYKNEIVDSVIKLFMEELKDSMINNERVVLHGYFSFRHKISNQKSVTNIWTKERVLTPEIMKFRCDVAKKILDELNKLYRREKRVAKTLNNNRLEGLNK